MILTTARLLLAGMLVCVVAAAHAAGPVEHPSMRFGALLYQDDFLEGLSQWHLELERPGRVSAKTGALHIEVPAGATLWFKHEITGPVAIVFDATVVNAGGLNDRVSDLGCFWMARNRDGVTPVHARRRTGRFTDYNDLLAYYAVLGANDNTITRFRRYTGEPVLRPLLPEHDVSARDALLNANRSQTITLIASGRTIEYWRNAQRLFEYFDPEPYRAGWFGLRTTHSHLKIERFRVYALQPAS